MENKYGNKYPIEIENIISSNMNSNCFDCYTQNPNFVSLNNGVFLCENCSKIHKEKFSIEISQIVPLSEITTQRQILFLKKGGNENYKNIMNQYHVITIKDLNLKYRSKFAYYYRKHLENIVNLELNPNYKIEFNPEPDMKTGVEIEENYLEKIGSFFKSTGESINNKYNEIKNSETIQNIGNKAAETASSVGQSVSDGVSSLWSKAKGYFFGGNNQ